MAGTVLVTGTGAVGGEVLRRLVAEGVQVCAAAHTPAKAAPLERAGIATVALAGPGPTRRAVLVLEWVIF
jgi:uncharacterized protein YbjT (DUF2867 family)